MRKLIGEAHIHNLHLSIRNMHAHRMHLAKL
jgi:hypothetical protein